MEKKNGKEAKEEWNSSTRTLLDQAALEFERLNIRDSESEEEQSSKDRSTVIRSNTSPIFSELEENVAPVSASSAQNTEVARNRSDEDNEASGEENTTASVANPSLQCQAELRREMSGTTYISINLQVLLLLDRRRRYAVVRERISYRRYHSSGQIRNELPPCELPPRVLRLPSRREQDASASFSPITDSVRRSRFWFIPGNPDQVLPLTRNNENSQVASQSRVEVQVITVFLIFTRVGYQAEILNLIFVTRVADELEIHHIFFNVFHS